MHFAGKTDKTFCKVNNKLKSSVAFFFLFYFSLRKAKKHIEVQKKFIAHKDCFGRLLNVRRMRDLKFYKRHDGMKNLAKHV